MGYLNRDRRPHVERGEVTEAEWEPLPADLSQSQRVEAVKGKVGKGKSCGKDAGGGYDIWSSKGKDGWDAKGKGKIKSSSGQKATETGEIYTGSIKSMSEWYNNGFICCEELQGKY